MANGLRLMVYIASFRKLFEKTELTPEHIGKWARLRELWPDLSMRMLVDANLTHRLEEAAARSLGDLEDELEDELIQVHSIEDLRDSLSTGPELSPVLPVLLYLEPIGDPPPA